MSSEIQLKSPLTTVQYATVYNAAGLVWNVNTVAFESFVAGNQHYYAIALSGSGVGNNYLSANFPTAIVTSGVYTINIYSQAGATPNFTNDTLLVSGYYNWPGASVGPANNYITLAALKTYLGITVSTFDTLLTQLLQQASQAITNSLLRNPFLCFYFEEYDGTGYSFLKTNNYPIVALTGLINNYQSSAPSGFTASNFIYNQEGTIRWTPSSNNAGFCPGYQNWLVAYEAGYNVIPQDLQLACCMYVQFLYFYSQKDPTITSKTAKEVTIAYGLSLAGDFTSALFRRLKQS